MVTVYTKAGADTALQIVAGRSNKGSAFGVFYPENYGAVGDGTTDDGAAFSAAYTAAAAVGTTESAAYVKLTPGVSYRIKTSVIVKSNTILDAYGAQIVGPITSYGYINSGNNPSVPAGTNIADQVGGAAFTDAGGSGTISNVRFLGAHVVGFRYGFVSQCFAWAHPVWRDCNFENCNIGIFAYQGAQEHRLYNTYSSGGGAGTTYVAAATAFASGSTYAGLDNYFCDGFLYDNAGTGRDTSVTNATFDTWFAAAILRPATPSVTIGNSGGSTYPLTDANSLAVSGRNIYIPQRNNRSSFSPTIRKALSQSCDRGIAFIANPVQTNLSNINGENLFAAGPQSLVVLALINGQRPTGVLLNIDGLNTTNTALYTVECRTPSGSPGGGDLVALNVMGATPYNSAAYFAGATSPVQSTGSLAGVRRGGSLLPLPPTGTRTVWANALSNGTDTGQNTFLQHYLPAGISEVRFAYANVYGFETAGPNTIVLKAGCGLSGGSVFPVFFRGSRTLNLEGGAVVVSDPVAIPSGTTYVQSRTNVSVTAGQKWPIGFPDNLSRTAEGAEKGTSMTDKTLTGTIANPGASGVAMYGPVAVIGRPAGGQWQLLPAVVAMGDSILYGQGDAQFPVGGRGFFERAVNNTVGFINTGNPTETIAQFTSAAGAQSRLQLAQGATAILAQHGRNDVAAGTSFTTMRSLLNQYWSMLARTGARVFQCTLLPTSTSTDGWTSTGGQTTDASNTVRAQVNDWIRDGGPLLSGSPVATGSSAAGTIRAGATGHPLTGYFEIADTVETARNSGIWKIDPTQRTVTDAAMTSGSDQLTSATAGFSNADVYATYVRVNGAGPSGAVLSSIIRFYPGGSNVNLQDAASTTVSGATAVLYSPFTSDGVHPATKGAIAMAAAVNVAALSVLPTV